MSDHAWLESAAAYALGALDEGERAPFEAHLADCPRCRAEVATMRDTLGLLAHGAPDAEPSPGLRDRVLAEARRVRPIGRRPARGPWLLAAASVVIAAALGAAFARERAASAGASAALAEARRLLAARDSTLAALLSPDVHVASLAPTAGQPRVRVFWNRDRNVFVVTAFDLPAAPAGRTYQLWALGKGAPAPVSMGLFNSGPDGRATLVIPVTDPVLAMGLLEACALTEEPAGGSSGPTETPRLVGGWRQASS
jgi:anti-sigma-K factor RskA